MFNVARQIFTRAKKAMSLFVGQGPMSAMPVRSVPTTDESGNNHGLVDFKGVTLASSPKWVWFKKAHKLWLEVLEGRFIGLSIRSLLSTIFLLPKVHNSFLDKVLEGRLWWWVREKK